ncbi:MAG: prepilin-type N-terminal cleavage/methylation domain-containing protein [Phycisphaerales bacterium]|nr:prepilin-type N-terminal cleavage/methylation domain-containing protein [Phycisphaerales bacterium]
MDRKLKAFTLIELLVVISIIALLIGILLPALSSARASAQSLVCKATMKNLATLNTFYASENREYYSSPVNIGTPYTGNVIVPGEGVVSGADAMLGNTESITPTTVQDWISPIAGDSMNFSSNRAERTRDIFNNFGCARANVFNDTVYAGANAADIEEFAALAEEGIQQVSYLMPTGFAHVSQDDDNYLRSLVRGATFARINNLMSVDRAPQQPKGFRHRMDRVGTSASSKIMFADGTRYWEDSAGLDFDPDLNALFGSFTSSSPIFSRSTAYGRDFAAAADTGNNLLLSYRHDEAINVARFDTSVNTMSQAESYIDPNPWYPTGTRWEDNDSTQESIDFMREQSNGRSNPTIY